MNNDFSHKTTEISKMFGVTLRTVSSLFASLKATESIQIEEQYSVKGRGQYRYTITENVLKTHDTYGLLKRIISSQCPTVERLLRNDLSQLNGIKLKQLTPPDITFNRSKFRASNRLLLTVFLLHADRFGIVENLSSTHICNMLGGIKDERFKSLLNTLKKMDLIRCHIAGITGKEMFGRTKASYYLNTMHNLLIDSYRAIGLVSLDFHGCLYPWMDSTEAKFLFDAYRNRNHQVKQKSFRAIEGLIDEYPLYQIMHFFRNPMLHNQLHQWIYQIASELMALSSVDLKKITPNDCSDKLKELLALNKTVPVSRRLAVSPPLQLVENEQKNYESQFLADVLSFNTFPNEDASIYWQHVILTRLAFILGARIAFRYQDLLQLVEIDYSHIEKFLIVPIQDNKQPNFKHQLCFIGHEDLPKETTLCINKNGDVTMEPERQSSKQQQVTIQQIHNAFSRRLHV